jgi:prepilin-type N-terminal cleavage/methylation domain-containing protein
MRRPSGFTLIELLIVVAIIAILAAIAVPNFLEAQTRAKVSRVKADMRSAATALEAYAVDNNCYPFDGYYFTSPGWTPASRYNYWYLPTDLSTPIAYMSTCVVPDPFRSTMVSAGHWQFDNVRYTHVHNTWGLKFNNYTGRTSESIYYPHMMAEFGGWRMVGNGPDRVYGPTFSNPSLGWPGVSVAMGYPQGQLPNPYDPTNGTISGGDIIRSQLSTNGYVNSN